MDDRVGALREDPRVGALRLVCPLRQPPVQHVRAHGVEELASRPRGDALDGRNLPLKRRDEQILELALSHASPPPPDGREAVADLSLGVSFYLGNSLPKIPAARSMASRARPWASSERA